MDSSTEFGWLDDMGDHVIITDENAVILHANKATMATTGYSREEIVGKKAGSVWGGNMSREFYSDMWQTIKVDRKPFVGVVKNRKKDGQYYFAELRIYPVLDASGNLRHFIAIEPDITDRVTREVVQDNFISLVRHELRNTIGVSRLMLDILSQDTLTLDQRGVIENIAKENIRMQATIDTLSLIEGANRLTPSDLHRVSLNDVVQTALERFAGEKGTAYTMESDGECVIVSSRSIVTHVVENLISNAIKYSPQGGQIRIELHKEHNGCVFICTDSGIGIPEADMQHIFDPFFRASNAKREHGTGIGLFVSRELLNKIGGRIQIESSLNEGTCVTVFLPF